MKRYKANLFSPCGETAQINCCSGSLAMMHVLHIVQIFAIWPCTNKLARLVMHMRMQRYQKAACGLA